MNKLNHVAFIMDGNGRWGQNKKKGRNFGHINGVKTVRNFKKWAMAKGDIMNSSGNGLITIDNLHLKKRLILDIRDKLNPERRIEDL